MKFYPEFFRRLDERPDALFYREPRLVRHMDDGAAEATARLYARLLPAGGRVLDLMASYHSHLDAHAGEVVGLGLNATEMRENPRIGEAVVHDLNRTERLPFGDGRFDGAVCSVSVQYLTRPDEVFPEVARCLKPGGPFIVTFSNRMFPTKAILAWRASDDAAHLRLVRSYFENAADFGPVQHCLHTPGDGDPLYGLWAFKTGADTGKSSGPANHPS